MHNSYQYHFENMPHLVDEESDTDRYLRAYSSLTSSFDDVVTIDDVIEAMRYAVRFIADDAFKRGFEASYTNIVVPLRENTIAREAALAEMQRYGEVVRRAITGHFEEAPGVPNQITVEIDELPLPTPRLLH